MIHIPRKPIVDKLSIDIDDNKETVDFNIYTTRDNQFQVVCRVYYIINTCYMYGSWDNLTCMSKEQITYETTACSCIYGW